MRRQKRCPEEEEGEVPAENKEEAPDEDEEEEAPDENKEEAPDDDEEEEPEARGAGTAAAPC